MILPEEGLFVRPGVGGVGGDYVSLLMPRSLGAELVHAAAIIIYVAGVIYGSRHVHALLTKRGLSKEAALYVNRKLIHVLAGGVVALLVPYLFSSPAIPSTLAVSSGLALWLMRRRRLMTWFQARENVYESSFCVTWGVVLLASWTLLGSPTYGLVATLFMSFGDAATGIVRIAIYGERNKSWWGNLAMFAVCLPIAWLLVGPWGALPAALSSFIERYELKPLGDNVAIGATSLISLLILFHLGLIR
ncbi:MAG: dolichol kinase [Candidatus Nezhaarchaeota archaeon]|nr:dolichol kinase [Candidatus Nezhaarchaeota archaeon]